MFAVPLLASLYDEEFASDTEDDDMDYEVESESDDEMDIDDEDEEMDIDDNNDEEIDINENISVELIDFVKSNLQPCQFNPHSDGRGILYRINHPKYYNSMIPFFIQLQKYVHSLKPIQANFKVIPVYSYGLKYVSFDVSDLRYLYIQSGMGCITQKQYRASTDTKIKWGMMNIHKKKNYKFSGYITTNSSDVSVLYEKARSKCIIFFCFHIIYVFEYYFISTIIRSFN